MKFEDDIYLTRLCNPAVYYKERREDIHESRIGTLLEDDITQPQNDEKGAKPIRMLNDFIIFRPLLDNKLVALDALDSSNMHGELVAVGSTRPLPEIDEDEGQEDDLEEDTDIEQGVIRIRLGGILHYWTDYSENAS